MNELLSSFGVLLLSFFTALFLKKGARRLVSCGGVVLGSVLGLIPALRFLGGGSVVRSLGSPLPGLNLSLGLDPLSAFFLAAIFGLSGLIAIYGWGYVKDQPRLFQSLPFFPLLVAAMAAVVSSRDGFLFLIAWEVMSLASFFLVTAEHEIREVRHAGWIYLIATHLATAFLLAFFVLLYKETGTFSFEDFAHIGPLTPILAGLLFAFALVGFGTKAGIFPLHVWLPHAHPAAPSYISALMSAVMIKTGIYGILRTLTFLGTPPLWWGGMVLSLGILSALLGALFALVQHDLKRMLAYSSIENIGIIAIGIGLGLLGATWNEPMTMTLGFGGALFHVWNHAILKGMLFLGAGNILHVTHTRAIDRMGGLLKIMPVTGGLLIGPAAALSGLPPFNAFLSEWLLYRGLFSGVQSLSGLPLFMSIVGIIGLALAGGLILAAFAKMVGIIFLGEPRQEFRKTQEFLWLPSAILGILGLAGALAPLAVWPAVISAVRGLYPSLPPLTGAEIAPSLGLIGRIFFSFFLVSAFLTLLWRLRVRRLSYRQAVTWDCGYALPGPRMQYTASSFVEPLAAVFRPLLKPRVQETKPAALFPGPASFSEHTEDVAERGLFKPLFGSLTESFLFLKRLQKGRIQGYLALILAVLVLLLLWEVWFGI